MAYTNVLFADTFRAGGGKGSGVACDIYAANTVCTVPENIHTFPKEGFFLRSPIPLEILIISVEESTDIFWQNSLHNGKQGNRQTKGSSYFAIIHESFVGNNNIMCQF